LLNAVWILLGGTYCFQKARMKYGFLEQPVPGIPGPACHEQRTGGGISNLNR